MEVGGSPMPAEGSPMVSTAADTSGVRVMLTIQAPSVVGGARREAAVNKPVLSQPMYASPWLG